MLQWSSYSVAQAKIFRRRDDGTMGCRRDGAAFIQHAEDEILAAGRDQGPYQAASVARSDIILPSRTPKLSDCSFASMNGFALVVERGGHRADRPAANAGPRTPRHRGGLDKLRQFGPLPSREF